MLAPVTEIFCDIDDFCKDYSKNKSKYLLPNPHRIRHREMQMSLSEIGTIVVLAQMSHYRTFKDFYCNSVLRDMESYFPNVLSYTRLSHVMILQPFNRQKEEINFVFSAIGSQTFLEQGTLR